MLKKLRLNYYLYGVASGLASHSKPYARQGCIADVLLKLEQLGVAKCVQTRRAAKWWVQGDRWNLIQPPEKLPPKRCETGYFARATGEPERGMKQVVTGVHIIDAETRLPICGYKPHKTLRFHFCAAFVHRPYVECPKCIVACDKWGLEGV